MNGYFRFTCLCMITFGLCPPSPVRGQTSEGRRYALLVGIREYDPNEMRALPYTENDVTELAGVLKANGYKADDVVLMTQKLGAAQTRFLPTAKNVRNELKLPPSTASVYARMALA